MTVPAEYERASAQFYDYLVDAGATARNGRGRRAMLTGDADARLTTDPRPGHRKAPGSEHPRSVNKPGNPPALPG